MKNTIRYHTRSFQVVKKSVYECPIILYENVIITNFQTFIIRPSSFNMQQSSPINRRSCNRRILHANSLVHHMQRTWWRSHPDIVQLHPSLRILSIHTGCDKGKIYVICCHDRKTHDCRLSSRNHHWSKMEQWRRASNKFMAKINKIKHIVTGKSKKTLLTLLIFFLFL